MSEHRASISWRNQSDSFAYDDYTREHEWRFPNGKTVEASSAPRFLGKEEFVDPEEAFVASVSSCHMLTFLAICARKRIVVMGYDDDAVGYLEENEDGRLAITRVTLRPRITFEVEPPPEVLEKIHHKSHEQCFIANSIRTQVTVES